MMLTDTLFCLILWHIKDMLKHTYLVWKVLLYSLKPADILLQKLGPVYPL